MKLLNKSKVKQAALELAQQMRPANGFTRVSQSFIDWLEVEVRAAIRQRIHATPSLGVTLK